MDILNLHQLGQLARSVREGAGLTQAQAAERVGSTQPAVSAAEKGLESRYARVAVAIIETIGNRPVQFPLYGVAPDGR